MTQIVYAGKPEEYPAWRGALGEAGPEFTVGLPGEIDPAAAEYVLYAPSGPVSNLRQYTAAKAILSLWAGVETLLANPTLPPPPPEGPALVRMVEPGLTRGMTEYVLGHVLRIHLGMDRQRAAQARGEWLVKAPPLAESRRVTIFGLGALGSDAAAALKQVGFTVTGWSRTPKILPGVRCLSGAEGFKEALARADIGVILLPLTTATARLFDAEALARLPAGAHLINAARGPLIEERALIKALKSGRMGGATLDVFDQEPLPADHPLWRTPNVTITAHVASVTRPETAAGAVVEQIRRGEAGEPFLYVVDRTAGY